MSRRTYDRPPSSGFCRTAADVESGFVSSSEAADWWHGRCRGAIARPDAPVTRMVGGKVVDGVLVGAKSVTTIEPQEPCRCGCPCHDGQTIEVAAPPPTVIAKILEHHRTGGGRSKKLREQIALELKRSQGLEVPKTGDDYEDHKIAGRIHSAAQSVGLKVRVSLKGDTILAEVK